MKSHLSNYLKNMIVLNVMMNYKKNYNKYKRDLATVHAQFKKERLGHYKVHKCPCCGTDALITSEYWTDISTNKTRVEMAECSLCTYKINFNIGEPKDFGIMETELFTF